MNKTDLISKIAESSDLPKSAAEKAVNTVMQVVSKALASGESINLVGFGSFSVTKRAARTGRNPQTGKAIKIAESKVVKFKVGKKLKDSVNAKPAGCGCGCKAGKKK